MPLGNDLDLRLRDLRALSVILRECSLTRAAELLETTQPSISKILARLREYFGDPPVLRDGHGMQLTPRAIELAERLPHLLAASAELTTSSASFDPGASDRSFRLLVTDVGSLVFLPPLMTRFAREASRINLRAVPLQSRHFETKLEAGEADLALGAFPGAPRYLRRQRLYVEKYVSVVQKDQPNLMKLRDAAGFRAARHIVVMASEVGHAAHQLAQQALEAELPPERVMLRLTSFVSAAVIAARTDAIATVPRKVARLFAEQLDLAIFPPPITLPTFEIAQYWHERYHRDAGHRWLRAVSFELFAKAA